MEYAFKSREIQVARLLATVEDTNDDSRRSDPNAGQAIQDVAMEAKTRGIALSRPINHPKANSRIDKIVDSFVHRTIDAIGQAALRAKGNNAILALSALAFGVTACSPNPIPTPTIDGGGGGGNPTATEVFPTPTETVMPTATSTATPEPTETKALESYRLNYDPYNFRSCYIPIEDLYGSKPGELSPFVRFLKKAEPWPEFDFSKLTFAPLTIYKFENEDPVVFDNVGFRGGQSDYPIPESNPYQRGIYCYTKDGAGHEYFLSPVRVAIEGAASAEDYPILIAQFPLFNSFGQPIRDESVQQIITLWTKEMNYPVFMIGTTSNISRLPNRLSTRTFQMYPGLKEIFDELTITRLEDWDMQKWAAWKQLDGAVLETQVSSGNWYR